MHLPCLPISRLCQLAACAAWAALASPAQADTFQYSFSGTYFVAGGQQAYQGSFVVADPVALPTLPAGVSNANALPPEVWQGSSTAFSGGGAFELVFASGTTLRADTIAVVVNNTTYAGAGSPDPDGLSVQLYPGALQLTPPVTNVCATPTGVCGEDDDPLYHDATQDEILRTSSVYLTFWGAPLGPDAMPDLSAQFGASQGGLGILRPNAFGFYTTTLTQLQTLDATVTPSVPEPAAWVLLLPGLLLLRRARPSAAA